jgi:hypothetical protein
VRGGASGFPFRGYGDLLRAMEKLIAALDQRI